MAMADTSYGRREVTVHLVSYCLFLKAIDFILPPMTNTSDMEELGQDNVYCWRVVTACNNEMLNE